MSRPKIVTPHATKLFRAEAIRRVDNRSNKELARELAELGIHLSPQYIGKLVADEIRLYRARTAKIHVRMFHGEQDETEDSSRTIG